MQSSINRQPGGSFLALYSIAGHELSEVSHLRDLKVIVSADLKFARHCASISAKAFLVLCLILGSFTTNNSAILMRACMTFARPLLESATQVWSPHLLKDKEKIERVQRFFTRRVCKRARIPGANYMKRLHILKIDSLLLCRLKFDLRLVSGKFELSSLRAIRDICII